MTNIELAILGLIVEKAKHGYQIEQDIEIRGMREWTEIGFSSIYYILNKLEKAGLLTSKLVVDGGGPARKVYQLTDMGFVDFKEAVLSRLSQPRLRSGDFDLALSFMIVLEKEEIFQALQTYHSMLLEKAKTIQDKWDMQGGQKLSSNICELFDHSLQSIQFEINWLEGFISRLE
ncbi:MAG: PadR family transcriptional regulator [Anaerolineaceae bacterium]|nr:PadR family transcriptional regulator [Anaerolineaceae bacterium]